MFKFFFFWGVKKNLNKIVKISNKNGEFKFLAVNEQENGGLENLQEV